MRVVARVLRAGAVSIAVAAMLDPVVPWRRSAPPSLGLRTDHSTAEEIGKHVRERLGSIAELNGAEAPDAVVLIGAPPDLESLPAGTPVSAIANTAGPAPNVRLNGASDSGAGLPGRAVTVSADLESQGMAGRSSIIVLELAGVELDRLEHRWTLDHERFTARLTFSPPAPGIWTPTVRVLPAGGEAIATDNAALVRVACEARTLRIAAYDARPSWAATFVRRALEADPLFELSTLTHVSRGLLVSSARAPWTLSVEALRSFDAVLVGAPEELAGKDVDALASFARQRGGIVVFLPDRRPAGQYVELVRSRQFDEVLHERGQDVTASTGARFRGSEFAIPALPDPAATVLATLHQGTTPRPVVFARRLGGGWVLFSGALDAWRFRSANDGAFATFWRMAIGELASAAPRPLEVSVRPAAARPGEPVLVRAVVRQTELSVDDERTVVPRVAAQLIAADGTGHTIRLWPSAETGMYEGRLSAPSEGTYDVRAVLAERVTAVTPLVVSAAAPRGAAAEELMKAVAAATGGVYAPLDDLGRLEAHVRSLSRRQIVEARPVMRSFWWTMAFIVLLCAEWILRRRSGLR